MVTCAARGGRRRVGGGRQLAPRHREGGVRQAVTEGVGHLGRVVLGLPLPLARVLALTRGVIRRAGAEGVSHLLVCLTLTLTLALALTPTPKP